MDRSKEYIKMCYKAKEIQKEWQPRQSDIIISKEENKYFSSPVPAFYDGWGYAWRMFTGQKWFIQTERALIDYNIWLPRQDQLQEMVSCEYKLIKDPKGFCAITREQTVNYNRGWHFNSMERLWLAFVMKEKYDKIWNGKDWVKNV